jgi:hypothetical protein
MLKQFVFLVCIGAAALLMFWPVTRLASYLIDSGRDGRGWYAFYLTVGIIWFAAGVTVIGAVAEHAAVSEWLD